jgi:hypothetical protein
VKAISVLDSRSLYLPRGTAVAERRSKRQEWEEGSSLTRASEGVASARSAVDVGGTFADVVLVDVGGWVATRNLASTPDGLGSAGTADK